MAKLNLALSSLPAFEGLSADALSGRVRIAPDLDYLERAFDHSKYGRYSTEPYIEFTIPTVADRSLAPDGAHVLSAYVQFAPYVLRDRDWEAEAEPFARIAVNTIERFAPGLRSPSSRSRSSRPAISNRPTALRAATSSTVNSRSIRC